MNTTLARTAATAVLAAATVVAGGSLSPAAAASYQPSPTAGWVPNGTVYAMARSGSTVYLGGDFTSLTNPATGQSVARSHLAAVDAGTGAPASWNPGANGTVRALAVGSNSTVYAGGTFTSAAGADASRLAAITPTGRAVSGWKATANGTVNAILTDSTGVYAAGAFSTVNAVARAKLARLAPATGTVDTAFNARVAGGSVLALAKSGANMLLGGSFTTLSGTARTFSGSVALGTGAVTSWAPASQCSTCTVLSLITDGTRAYQGIAGPGGRVIAVSLGSGSRTWTKSGDGDVQALAVYGGVLYAGGHFTSFAGSARRQLVALSASTGAVQDYALAFTGSDGPGIWAVSADSAALRIAGGFQLAGSPIARYAAFRTA